jgi:hypothetical protein
VSSLTLTTRLLASFALYCLLGCRAAKLIDLPGRYLVTTDWGESTLILRADHTMEQGVRTKRGEIKHVSGTWDFNNETVTLKPCLEVRWKTEGLWAGGCANAVEVTGFGRIEIAIDSQYGLAYRKKTGP